MVPQRENLQTFQAASAGLLACLVVAASGCGRSERGLPSAPSSPAEQAYLHKISIRDARMSAARNFLGDTVITMEAKVTNGGQQTIRSLDLDLEFMDIDRQNVVLRTEAHPITFRTPPLRPGETRTFTVSFEHMPGDWNQGPPRITPARVIF